MGFMMTFSYICIINFEYIYLLHLPTLAPFSLLLSPLLLTTLFIHLFTYDTINFVNVSYRNMGEGFVTRAWIW